MKIKLLLSLSSLVPTARNSLLQKRSSNGSVNVTFLVQEISEKLQQFWGPGSGAERSQSQVCITLVWRQVGDSPAALLPVLSVAPLSATQVSQDRMTLLSCQGEIGKSFVKFTFWYNQNFLGYFFLSWGWMFEFYNSPWNFSMTGYFVPVVDVYFYSSSSSLLFDDPFIHICLAFLYLLCSPFLLSLSLSWPTYKIRQLVFEIWGNSQNILGHNPQCSWLCNTAADERQAEVEVLWRQCRSQGTQVATVWPQFFVVLEALNSWVL